MLKAKTLTALSASLALGLTATAAPIVTVTESSSGGNDYFIFTVDPNGTTFDTIDFTATALPGTTFLGENNPAVTEFTPAGVTPNTDVLGLNTVALGWSILGGSDSPTLFTAAGGPLGQDINSSVTFAQVVVADKATEGGSYTFQFADDAQLVDTISGNFGVPEPSSLALLGLGGLLIARRRRG